MATRCRFFPPQSRIWSLQKGNRICLPGTLSLSPALGSVHLSSLTACRTQGGMKLETPPSTHLHSLVLRNLYHELFTLYELELIQSDQDYKTASFLQLWCNPLQIQTWNKLILLIRHEHCNTSSSYHPMHFFNEWIDHSAFHEAPLGNAIVRFKPHFVVITPFFALHVFLSSDWLSWCAGCFSRHPWIPLIHPSFKSFHIRRHLPPHKSHTMGVWTEENPMGRGRLPSRLELLWQKGDLPSPAPLSFTFVWSCWK